MTWRLRKPNVEIVQVDALKYAHKCPTWAVQLFIDGRLKSAKNADLSAVCMFILDDVHRMGSPDVLIKHETDKYSVMDWNEFYKLYEQLPEAAQEIEK